MPNHSISHSLALFVLTAGRFATRRVALFSQISHRPRPTRICRRATKAVAARETTHRIRADIPRGEAESRSDALAGVRRQIEAVATLRVPKAPAVKTKSEWRSLVISTFENDPLDAAFGKMFIAEIDHQAKWLIHELQVSEKLHTPDVHVLVFIGLCLCGFQK